MTELHQARADYVAALQREHKLTNENDALRQQVFELKMKLAVTEFRAATAEMFLKTTVHAALS